MAPEKHAVLSASSAFRWINCPPSALLCALLPDASSPYAEEGTRAHAWCEYKLLKLLGRECEEPDFEPTNEMIDAAFGYLEYIGQNVGEEASIFVEQRVGYSTWAPGGFGTVDCLAADGNTLKIFDFKYGQGVEVDAEWNPQLLCYALGAYAMLGTLYEFERVETHIFQPRRAHTGVFNLSLNELLNWARGTLEPAAELAWNGKGEAKAGDWCRFCKATPTCRALADQMMETAAREFRDPPGMSTQEIENVLPKLDLLISWASELKDYAFRKALRGHKFKGYKLVEGRSVRCFRSETEACLKIKEAGFNPYTTKMKGLTELKKEMGQKNFEEVCGGLLEKPAGKPVLVPVTDKRPELDLSAAADFED